MYLVGGGTGDEGYLNDAHCHTWMYMYMSEFPVPPPHMSTKHYREPASRIAKQWHLQINLGQSDPKHTHKQTISLAAKYVKYAIT